MQTKGSVALFGLLAVIVALQGFRLRSRWARLVSGALAGFSVFQPGRGRARLFGGWVSASGREGMMRGDIPLE